MTARHAPSAPTTKATPSSGGRIVERATGARKIEEGTGAVSASNKSAAGVTTALIYTRVSSDEQARDGISLDAQLAECRRYAAGRGWLIGTEYQDVLKGTRDDRPQYQALMADVRQLRAQGCSVAVVVASLDRFGRAILERVRSREELKKLDVLTHSVREGGEVSDIVANVLAAVAQEEVRRLGERVSAAKRHVIASGWTTGGRPPWGYVTRDATDEERRAGAPKRILDMDLATAPFAREMFERVASGQTVRAVARWILALPAAARGRIGHGRGTDRRMGWQAVRWLLSSPTYVARSDGGAAEVLARPVGRWPALIDDVTWQRVQDRITAHARMPRQASGRYLLTGLARCSQCRGRMIGAHRKDGGRPQYRCSNGGGAHERICYNSATAPLVDAAVLGEVASLLDLLTDDDPLLLPALRRAWQRLTATPSAGLVEKQRHQLENAVVCARARLRNAALLMVDGALDRAGYELARDQAQSDLNAAEAELTRMTTEKIPAATLPPLTEVLASAGSWCKVLGDSDMLAQRDVLAALIDQATLVRTGYRAYAAEITWTPLGEALHQASEILNNKHCAGLAS
jgi:DNA invertase Pin-like site-specific DNA recombinase